MKEKLILNLRLEEVEGAKKMFSLMNLILRNLKQLKLAEIEVEYFELRLHQTPLVSSSKEAYIKIDANNRTFTGTETATRWEDAIHNLCEKLRSRILGTAKTAFLRTNVFQKAEVLSEG